MQLSKRRQHDLVGVSTVVDAKHDVETVEAVFVARLNAQRDICRLAADAVRGQADGREFNVSHFQCSVVRFATTTGARAAARRNVCGGATNMPAAQTSPPTKGAAWAAEDTNPLGRFPFTNRPDVDNRRDDAAPTPSQQNGQRLSSGGFLSRAAGGLPHSPIFSVPSFSHGIGEGAAHFISTLADVQRRPRNPIGQGRCASAPLIGLRQGEGDPMARAGAGLGPVSARHTRRRDQRNHNLIHQPRLLSRRNMRPADAGVPFKQKAFV